MTVRGRCAASQPEAEIQADQEGFISSYEKAFTRNGLDYPSDARIALRLFRRAVNIIRLPQRSAIPRWSDGMTAWLAAERPPIDRDDFLFYREEELQRYREARDLLLQSIALNPFFSDAYLLLGNAYHEIDGDSELMIRYYDDAIALDPDNAEFHNARMSHYLSTGDLDQALVDLEHLERLQSGYAESMREHYENAKLGG